MTSVSSSDAPDDVLIDDKVRGFRGLHRLLAGGQHFMGQRGLELELGASDLTVMGHLFFEGPQSPGQLSERMGVTSGTMTALLNRVQKAGFLRRGPNPQDRRGLTITLTPAGRHAMQWVYEHFERIIGEALTGFSQQDVQQFHSALNLLADSLCANAGNPALEDDASPAARSRRPQ